MPEENQDTKIIAQDIVSNDGSARAFEHVQGAENTNTSIVTSLRTLRNDLQDAVREQKMSLARVVALQQDRARTAQAAIEDPEIVAKQSRRRQFVMSMIFFITVLIGLGSAALFGVYVVMQSRVETTSTLPSSSLIFAEHQVGLVLSNRSPQDIKNILGVSRNSSTGTLGSITRIVPLMQFTAKDGTPQQRAATTQEFLTALDTHTSDELMRALGGSFFLGIHTIDKNAPVFVVSVLSYDHAFAGMLAWESNLNADLQPFFTPLPTLTIDAHGLPAKRPFEDVVMRNYDVRELKDDGGKVQMYYSFPNTHILIIAESPASFSEVLSRLQAARQL